MPVYEYHCDKCQREVTLTLTISEHDKGPVTCPKCGGKALRPFLSAFMTQTSKNPDSERGTARITRAPSHPRRSRYFR
jgi:putative FmdB family regulatory protein